MFEIEKDFNFEEEKMVKLLKEADFIGQKVFTDVYYDTDRYNLTSKNTWLRAREGLFELKIPMNGITDTDRYEEVEDEQKIKKFLEFNAEEILKNQLAENGYKPFLKLTTTRKKYKKGEFNIDIDNAEYDDGSTFKGMEIELMIEDEKKAQEASDQIIKFAEIYGLEQSYEGKISGYIRHKNPDHFKVLSDLGIFSK